MAGTEHIATRITDEALERLRGSIGERRGRGYDESRAKEQRVLRSQIRHWAVMVGDMRPLFVDLEYAQRSRWGTLIAPPGVVIHEERLDPQIDALPGSRAVLDAASVEWRLPIRLGDSLFAETVIVDVREIEQARARGRAVRLRTTTEVQNQERALVGTAGLEWTCYERGSEAELALYGGRAEPHMWEREDIDALGEEYKREHARGAEALAWGDVAVGEELPPVLKGPTTRHRSLGPGLTRWYWGHLQGWEAAEQSPELFFRNENGAPEPIVALDGNHHRAQRWGGLPGALEANSEHIHWLVHLLMNWMGDAGFLRRLDVRFPIQNMMGDVTRGYGRVTGKREGPDGGLVELEVWQENQLGQRITEGVAEIVLPLGAAAPGGGA